MSSPNPFTGRSGLSLPVPGFLKDWGFTLQDALMNTAGAVTEEGAVGKGLAAFGLSVAFGIVHIIGPGHGKLFTIGYFGSRRASLGEGLGLSALVNILDSLSALFVVLTAYGILSVSLQAAGASADRITKMVAYSAVALLGFSHLVGHLRHKHRQNPGRQMKPWMLALSVGLIPCPVSSALLAWGVVNNVLVFSALLVLGVSCGGMIAMTGFSFALIGGKSGLTNLLEKRGLSRSLHMVEIGFMIFLILTGIFLFFTVL